MKGERVREYLTKNQVPYISIPHRVAFSSHRTAHAAHVSGKMLAKTVLVRVDDTIIMIVMPASQKVDTRNLRSLFLAQKVELAREDDFRELFPDCEVGGMPPFGNLYGIDVYVSERLTQDDEIVFNAGTHSELLKMKYRDFEKLVHPRILKFV